MGNESSIKEYYISDYRCPGCNRPGERLTFGKNRCYIGVRHTDDCWFYRKLCVQFPKLMRRIGFEQAYGKAAA